MRKNTAIVVSFACALVYDNVNAKIGDHLTAAKAKLEEKVLDKFKFFRIKNEGDFIYNNDVDNFKSPVYIQSNTESELIRQWNLIKGLSAIRVGDTAVNKIRMLSHYYQDCFNYAKSKMSKNYIMSDLDKEGMQKKIDAYLSSAFSATATRHGDIPIGVKLATSVLTPIHRVLGSAFWITSKLNDNDKKNKKLKMIEKIIKKQSEKEKRMDEKKAAQDKAAQDKAAQEQAEKERLAKEQAAQDKAAQDKAEKERLAKEQAAQDKAAQDKAEKERLAKEQSTNDTPQSGGVNNTSNVSPQIVSTNTGGGGGATTHGGYGGYGGRGGPGGHGAG